jgi:hypothetical protein
MRDPLEFAILGLSVVGSISVAVVVEWIGLWGLMKMMPAPEPALESAAGTAEASPRAARQLPPARSRPPQASPHPRRRPSCSLNCSRCPDGQRASQSAPWQAQQQSTKSQSSPGPNGQPAARTMRKPLAKTLAGWPQFRRKEATPPAARTPPGLWFLP